MILAIWDPVRIAIEHCLNHPMPEDEAEAEYQAYFDWALNDMRLRISDKPYEDPEMIIEEFILEMAFYSSNPDDTAKEINPFSVAIEAADSVLSYLAAMEYPQEYQQEELYES